MADSFYLFVVRPLDLPEYVWGWLDAAGFKTEDGVKDGGTLAAKIRWSQYCPDRQEFAITEGRNCAL